MTELNSLHNRIVWCDIPVAQLDRAIAFYRAVLEIDIDRTEFDGTEFAIFEHDAGNGVCLIPQAGYTGCTTGPLVYLNVDRHIRAAVTAVRAQAGRVLQDVHPIGPHGVRALAIDSEGNRIALHSTVDG